jgi:hypothetical protein
MDLELMGLFALAFPPTDLLAGREVMLILGVFATFALIVLIIPIDNS